MRLLDLGVFVEEKSEMPNIVFFCFFFLSSAFVLAFFFSLPALQLHDPEILGKHPGSAVLLSLAVPPPPALSSLVPSTVSVTRNFLLINLSPTITYSDLYIFYILPKETICFDIVSLQENFSHNNMCLVKIEESLVMIDPWYGNSLQRMEGWGACVKIDFTCFTISTVPDFERRSLRVNIYI